MPCAIPRLSTKKIPVIGKCESDIQHNNKFYSQMKLQVVCGNVTNILERNWFNKLGILVSGVHYLKDSPID